MEKVLGIDLGTNSIGLSVRNVGKAKDLFDQLDYYQSIVFRSGVGNGKSGEFSYAAERTKKRSPRRLYQARKYRIWATLKLLIEHKLCPLTIEQLEKWSIYDKEKGLKREYPIDAKEFEQWVRLDFNADGIADYSSPYQLREELATVQLDFTSQLDCFKLGRSLYHIAQRRGFRSSKGDTLKEQEKSASESDVDTILNDVGNSMKKSELDKSKSLTQLMSDSGFKTVGSAFAYLERKGVRIRNSEYQAVRSQYKEEIKHIFSFQKGLDLDGDLFKRINSEKNKVGTIFFKRPLRSQKGLVGKCTLEPTKPRCPISHPEFETFRAFCFINNIKYRRSADCEWLKLTKEQADQLYKERFLLTATTFKFETIRTWIERQVGYYLGFKDGCINYNDKATVMGCPISGRLKNLFGNEWQSIVITTNKSRKRKGGVEHTITYTMEDIWHICFSADEAEVVEEFAQSNLGLDNAGVKKLVLIWGAIQEGYAQLSLKAMRNINPILKEGLVYSEAVMLANLPAILGDKLWDENKPLFIKEISGLIEGNRKVRQIVNIANRLIANYKSLKYNEELGYHERFAYKDTAYTLDSSDYDDILKQAKEVFGEKAWGRFHEYEQNKVVSEVTILYQDFFRTSARYCKHPKLIDTLKQFLVDNFDFLQCLNPVCRKNPCEPCNCSACKKLKKLYHPTQIAFYKPAKEQRVGDVLKLQLGSPVIGALKNPMAMRVLHILRKQINALLVEGVIDENTRVVVELAKEINDSNMRWAIERYQNTRNDEHAEFAKRIAEYFPKRSISDSDIEKVRLLLEQCELRQVNNHVNDSKQNAKPKSFLENYKKDITKYNLWLEQGGRCIYTGRFINIATLFDANSIDIEHTVPRSKSFDDSLENLTVCDSVFNRSKKRNLMPCQLSNYEDILRNIQPWIEKVESLRENVEAWKIRSRNLSDKDSKDKAIRQRHLWQMELNYWQGKVDRFTMQEVTTGFRNSQLNDTRIISKYAFHFLKSLFNHVEVQKGAVTDIFRKILGVQSVYEKKDRSLHSHHAIDATILTIIPAAAKREKMLKLFYQIGECEQQNEDVYDLRNELEKEIRDCRVGNISKLVADINENTLVNHISNDQTLTPAKRRARKRGKKVFVRDAENNLVEKWITGDTIRGQLHKDNFYGAITQAVVDDGGGFKRDRDGNLIIGDTIYYVIRRELCYKKDADSPGFKDWVDLRKSIVNKSLVDMIQRQFPPETSFKDAVSEGVYMLNKKNEIVNRIRHVRCYTTIKNPVRVKKQTYLSDKLYKQSFYADSGDLYAMCKYSNGDISNYEVYSLFDISENRKLGLEDIPSVINSKKGNARLELVKPILQVGNKILVGNYEMLRELDNVELLKFLYVIIGFEKDGRISCKKHTTSLSNDKLGKGVSVKNGTSLPVKIRQSVSGFSFLMEERDFEITAAGVIKFLE